ncbi:MAG: hypothetical protein V7750_05560 [Sneathiella sp.]
MTKTIYVNDQPIREAVGLFDDIGAVHDCIEELQNKGFERSDLTMLSRPEVIGSKSTLPIVDTKQTEDSQTASRGPVIEPETVGNVQGAALGAPVYIFTLCGAGISAAIGLSLPLLLLISGIAGIVGIGVGVYAMQFVLRRQNGYYRQQLDHGGIPLWIQTRDADHEKRAIETLTENRARDVHIHNLPRGPFEVDDGSDTVYKIMH